MVSWRAFVPVCVWLAMWPAISLVFRGALGFFSCFALVCHIHALLYARLRLFINLYYLFKFCIIYYFEPHMACSLSYLGKASTQRKNNRLISELTTHLGSNVSGGSRAVVLDYFPALRNKFSRPLMQVRTSYNCCKQCATGRARSSSYYFSMLVVRRKT